MTNRNAQLRYKTDEPILICFNPFHSIMTTNASAAVVVVAAAATSGCTAAECQVEKKKMCATKLLQMAKIELIYSAKNRIHFGYAVYYSCCCSSVLSFALNYFYSVILFLSVRPCVTWHE